MMDTVRRKNIENMEPGDFVCDMHYGMAQLHTHFNATRIEWDEPDANGRPNAKGSRAMVAHFSEYLSDVCRYTNGSLYGNKHLIVLSVELTSREPGGAISMGYVAVCGYSYDGRRCGIVTLKAK